MATATEKFQKMTGQIALPREFVIDFALYEARLRDEGADSSDIDVLKQCIRSAWKDEELRELWIAEVKKEADFMRELQAMANGITERIKAKTEKRAAT